MKKYLLISGFLISFISFSLSQISDLVSIRYDEIPSCGFQHMFKRSNFSALDLINNYKRLNNEQGSNTVNTRGDEVYDIPVVFHIMYHGPIFNIPDSVILNQVDILNGAFRKQHLDTALIRPYFKPLSGDSKIQFHLATKDPDGNPTNGIVRVHTERLYFGTAYADLILDSLDRVKRSSEGGSDPWPVKQYLNIWICNMSDSSGLLHVLGYGVPPLDPLPPNWPVSGDISELLSFIDGVVLQVHAVGSNSILNSGLQGIFSKGRALVHEVGHYLGLQHTFGSNDGGFTTASCGLLAQDGIDDTPDQSYNSFDPSSGFACPPASKNSCGAGVPGDLPDMWENYMDYSRDACQTMFTNDQINILRGVMAFQRNELVNPNTSSTGDNYTGIPLTLFPNPASQTINIRYPGNIDEITIRNVLGQVVLLKRGINTAQRTIDIGMLSPGNYFLSVKANTNTEIQSFIIIR